MDIYILHHNVVHKTLPI